MINKLVLRSPAARWNIATLARLLFVLRWLKRGGQFAGALFGLLLLTQLLYPRQLTRPFVSVDNASVGAWSSSKLKSYLKDSVATRPYSLAITGHQYKLMPAGVGISVDVTTTTNEATHYTLAERLTPFSLFKHARFSDKKMVNIDELGAHLQAFADARAQDPEDATLAKQDGIYSAVVPGKLGYIVNTPKLQASMLQAAIGSRLNVPRIAVQPKITEAMLQTALNNWRQQTGKPMELQLGTQPVLIPSSILQSWVIVTPNQKQDAVLITYDTAAIKSWLNGYAPRVYSAPKPATRYIEDDAVTQTVAGMNGSALNVDKSADAVVAALQTPAAPIRLAAASLQPLPFSTHDVRGYTSTSRGVQAVINDWAAQYKPGSVAASFQEIGGQSRSAALNDSGQFFTASIYKLFVVDYTYHLLESGQLDPNSLVLGAGKSVDDCLEVTIVVSDNTCPEALGDQLGWINIDAYAKQQGFTATSFVNHNWSTDTHDVASYLDKLNAGSLMNAADTANLLDKMQRQVYRSAIPAGSAGSTVQDKVGFYGSYWHDAAIVHSPKATYVLVVFTNGPGAGAIKNLAAQIQQTLNQ
ncbi:MAG TPA: serine hydrolase [Candidatus Saccharimonadales bacterium]